MRVLALLVLVASLCSALRFKKEDEEKVGYMETTVEQMLERIRSEVEAEEMTGEKALTEEQEKQLNDFLLGLIHHAVRGVLGGFKAVGHFLGRHVFGRRRNLGETSVAEMLDRIRSEVEAEEMTGEKVLTEEQEKQLNDFLLGLIHHAVRGVLGAAHHAVNFVGHVLGRRNLGETSVAQMLERIRSEVEAEEMTGEKALTARTKMPSALAIWGRRNLGETSVAQMLERN